MAWDVQTLFRSHAPGIARALTRRGAPPDLAEDLTQDVFVRLLQRRQKPSGAEELGEAAPFLLRIARNLLIDQWRRERLLPRVDLASGDLTQIADPVPLAEQRQYDRQRLERTAEALAAMPDRTRRAFHLHRVEGRTIAEVGAELGVSTTRAWGLIHEAYRLIRQRLLEE